MVFAISGFVYEQSQVRKKAQLASTKTTEFERMHSPVYGPVDAKVTIVEFFDPACESCRAFYPAVKQLVNINGGKVKLVLRYAPFHEGSEEVAKILEASRLQDKYWSTLETVLQMQPQWASHDNPQVNLIWGYLKASDLDIDKVRKDMSNPTIAAIVDQDKVDLRALQVTQTPTFFVNGKPLPKFGFEQLKTLVEAEVKTAYN
ncbi:disulfide bond formation protein DsbA [Pollutimonas nitritireducens]|uniref:Disulfide bond formation protein DsbA n=2 Tax=Pollutimonas nitritireducens TaxID=2045209 RepID=A0A2N4UD84_9BURK|nr:disulfide bond formation protein DsbA [Pollutimonas nitritireducens]